MSNYQSDLLRLLDTRGYIHDVTNAAGLDALAQKEIVPGYIGFDPTAPSLHVVRPVPSLLRPPPSTAPAGLARRLLRPGHHASADEAMREVAALLAGAEDGDGTPEPAAARQQGLQEPPPPQQQGPVGKRSWLARMMRGIALKAIAAPPSEYLAELAAAARAAEAGALNAEAGKRWGGFH